MHCINYHITIFYTCFYYNTLVPKTEIVQYVLNFKSCDTKEKSTQITCEEKSNLLTILSFGIPMIFLLKNMVIVKHILENWGFLHIGQCFEHYLNIKTVYKLSMHVRDKMVVIFCNQTVLVRFIPFNYFVNHCSF